MLHGHLCQTHLLLAVLVNEIEQGNNDEHGSQDKEDEKHAQHKQHTCEILTIHLTEETANDAFQVITINIIRRRCRAPW